MPDAVKAFRQNMDQEPADELARVQRHPLIAARSFDPVILEGEGHAFLIGGDKPPVGNGHAMGVAGKVTKDRLWPGKWTLGIDEPLDLFERRQEGGESVRRGETRVLAEELKFARLVGCGELFQHEPPEQLGENPHRQEEAAPAGQPARPVLRDATAGRNHVHVRMVRHRRAPAMEHGDESDPGAKMFGIGPDDQHRLGGSLEQKIVDHRLILIGDVRDGLGQSEHLVEVLHGQQFGLARLKPFARGGSLALRAVPIATAIISHMPVAAGGVLAKGDMAAERCCAAALDG